MSHPELGDELREIIEMANNASIVDIWCNGCGMYRQMNNNYSKYVSRLQGCRFCRSSESDCSE